MREKVGVGLVGLGEVFFMAADAAAWLNVRITTRLDPVIRLLTFLGPCWAVGCR